MRWKVGMISSVSEEIKDMLVASPESLDEACWMIPAIRALKASGLSVGVICPIELKPLWESVQGVDVIEYGKKVASKVLKQRLRGQWKCGLMWDKTEGAKWMVREKLPKRLGAVGVKWGSWATHCLTEGPHVLEHRVQYYMKALKEMGIETQVAEYYAARERNDQGIGKLLVVVDSDYGASHEWRPDGWYEVVRGLVLAGAQVTVVGLKGTRGKSERVAINLGTSVKYEERELGAGWMEELSGYRWMIAADSRLVHLAAYLGVRCAVLFGPNDVAWKRPMGRQHLVIRRVVECAPCLSAKCLLDQRCQEELTVEQVKEELEGWIGRES